MGRDDWFRNQDWSPDIEAAFFAKLARARRKAQHLRIQAGTIAQSHPRVALDLLDQYLALGEDFDIAAAHYDRATAKRALGDVAGAIDALEAALDREEAFPKLKTGAYIALPVLIVRERLTQRYNQALALLEKHRERVMFPVDFFHWNAVLAIVLSELGVREKAAEAARAAIEAAGLRHSGFRYHSHLGLVGDEDADLIKRVEMIARG
jgi:tetratricopeptide (TPR) repeat protein